MGMGMGMGSGQESHLQACQLMRQNSWYNLTLTQVQLQLGNLDKPLGSINLDELLENVWTTTEANELANDNTSSACQASLTLARAFTGKTIDQVWKEIQQGQNKRYGEDIKFEEREPTLADITLEDFLVQAGLFAQPSLTPSVELDGVDAVTPQHQMGLSPSHSFGTLSDTTTTTTTSGRKRDTPDAIHKSIERRLRRKIKNRESAARSRARKQAYHTELVSKVSRLEDENIKLKKEKEFENKLSSESPEPKFQLRRTSSASF